MFRGQDFLLARSAENQCSEEMRMNICSVESVQRVVNFTLNDEKMLREEPVGEIIPGVTMICDLPLLFVNGLPTCLESLSVAQLEKFVPYMTQCSSAAFNTEAKPKWWPDELEFSATASRPTDFPDAKWLKCLKRVVSNCYSYHGCDYALRLCVHPSHTCRSSEWSFIDGLDGTMSLYNKVTGKVSARLRTANVSCLKRGQVLAKAVMSRRAMNKVSSQKNLCSTPIYLCDNCDLEFSTSKNVQLHEKLCSQKHMSYVPCAREPLHPTRAGRANVPSTTRNSESADVPARTLRNQCFLQNTKQHIARKAFVHLTSSPRRLIQQESTVHTRPPYSDASPCKNGSSFFSFKRKEDNETSCFENHLQNEPVLPRTPPSISPPRNLSCNYLNTSNFLTSTSVSHNKRNFVTEVSPKKKKKVFQRMHLLPSKQNSQKDLQQLCQSDIYLCDQCEMEFTTFEEIKNHEIICLKKNDLTAPVISEKEVVYNQDSFLGYFKLKNIHSQLDFQSKDSSDYKKSFGNSLRYSGIPISSPLGIRIHSKSRLSSTVVSGKREKIERYCSSTPLALKRTDKIIDSYNAWRVSYKTCKNTTQNWAHTYKHPLQQWWRMPLMRKKQMKVQHNNESLLNLCKPLQIKLRRLTAQEIQNFTACQTLATKVKKLTLEEIQLYSKPCRVSPRLRRLSTQEIEAYTNPCTISPIIRRLSFQEIDKYVNHPTSIVTHGNIFVDASTSDKGIPSSSKTFSPNCAINRKKRKRKSESFSQC